MMYIPHCGWQCPIQRLYKLYDNVIPNKSYEEECGGVKDEPKPDDFPSPLTKLYWTNLWKHAFGWAN